MYVHLDTWSLHWDAPWFGTVCYTWPHNGIGPCQAHQCFRLQKQIWTTKPNWSYSSVMINSQSGIRLNSNLGRKELTQCQWHECLIKSQQPPWLRLQAWDPDRDDILSAPKHAWYHDMWFDPPNSLAGNHLEGCSPRWLGRCSRYLGGPLQQTRCLRLRVFDCAHKDERLHDTRANKQLLARFQFLEWGTQGLYWNTSAQQRFKLTQSDSTFRLIVCQPSISQSKLATVCLKMSRRRAATRWTRSSIRWVSRLLLL